jgi:DNA invertase Pin-like site-specific DNA recombinase
MQPLTPAAAYLRVSTEGQQYSLKNQRAEVEEFAAKNGYQIVCTYTDPGKSGLTLRERKGLAALLWDVVKTTPPYRIILVYDISRWGRFQDEDEAAHYEFLCKDAGIPVRYCAEPFANDNSMVSMIFKSLKRTMAGEFVRQLGESVFRSQKALAGEGFHIGNCPSYGLRRLLVSSEGKPKQIMERGEIQSVQSDRTVLVPGPPEEVATIREIFGDILVGKEPKQIAEELNRKGIRYAAGKLWQGYMVSQILRNPKYAGCNVWNRTSQKLRTARRKIPKEEWITKRNAFEGVVSEETFEKVQSLLDWRTKKISDAQALESLRILLKKKGRLSQSLIERAHKAREVPWGRVNYLKLGSLEEIYDQLGFNPNSNVLYSGRRRVRTMELNAGVILEIRRLFPVQLRPFHQVGAFRTLFRVDEKFDLSVLTCSFHPRYRTGQWQAAPAYREFRNMTLLCLLDQGNTHVQHYRLLPLFPSPSSRYFDLDAKWLEPAWNVDRLQDLYCLATEMSKKLEHR